MSAERTTRSLYRRLAAALVVVPMAAAATLTAPAESHERGAERFRAELEPLNAPDADGRATLLQVGDTLAVRLKADDLDGGIHVAHIHGFDEAVAECPTLAQDADGNGLVDLLEGLGKYGPVQVTLSNGLSDTGTRVKYRRTYLQQDDGSSIAALGDLSNYAIVVHGVDLDGDGLADNADADGDGADDANPQSDNEITMPALCGTIEEH